MKRFGIFLLFVSMAAAYGQGIGVKLDMLLPPDVSARLVKEGTLQNSVYRQKGAVPVLTPNLSLAREAVGFWNGADAAFFCENLFLYKKKQAGTAGIKQAEVEASGDGISPAVALATRENQKISSILRSISALEGLEYYSTSRKKMRLLYEKSYVVDNEASRKRIADPVTGNGNGLSLVAVQKDLTFGEYAYRYEYRSEGNSAAFFSRNIDPLRYTFIKLIEADKLRVSLVVHDLGDYLLVYGLTRADFPAIPGLDDKINASFTTRAQAMYGWFIKQYEQQN